MEKIKARGEYLADATVLHCECGCTVEKYQKNILLVRKISGCKKHLKQRLVGHVPSDHWSEGIVTTNIF